MGQRVPGAAREEYTKPGGGSVDRVVLPRQLGKEERGLH